MVTYKNCIQFFYGTFFEVLERKKSLFCKVSKVRLVKP